MQFDGQQPPAKRKPLPKLGVHPIRRALDYGRAPGLVGGPAEGVPGQSEMRQDAARDMPLLWEAACPRCRLVFGCDETGQYEESATDGTSGSDGQCEEEQ